MFKQFVAILSLIMVSCGCEGFLLIPSPSLLIRKRSSDTVGKLPFFDPASQGHYFRPCSSSSVLSSAVGDSADNIASTPSENSPIYESSSIVDLQKGGVPTKDAGGWKEKLLKASNVASMLCVLDCTVLPLVTVVLPLFGIVAASPAQMEWLHEFGHQVALFFVMPVGGLATTMNYTNHRKRWIASLGYLGLVAVLVANAGCHWAHDLPGPVGHFLHKYLHMLHHGVLHRVTNLAGCGLLLLSNFLSHRQGGCKDESCNHNHGHERSHDHQH